MPLRKILLVGMPGSGKGTQAKLLVSYGFKQISTGDLIREAFGRKDPLVMPYESLVKGGNLLPDKETFGLIDREIRGLGEARGYLLDGAIRNVAQAETALERDLLEEVLFFDLSLEEAIKRLCGRLGRERRADDSPEAVATRLEIYRKKTEPVIDYLSERDIPVYRVDTSDVIEEESENTARIHHEIIKILKLNK